MYNFSLFFLILFSLFSCRVHCQNNKFQWPANTIYGLRTVYKCLRTSEFNQQWENHKKYNDPNPYDQLVNGLMQINSSIASYITDTTQSMRADITQDKPHEKKTKFTKNATSCGLNFCKTSDVPDIEINATDLGNIEDIENDIKKAIQKVNYSAPINFLVSPDHNLKFAQVSFVQQNDVEKLNPTITIFPYGLRLLQDSKNIQSKDILACILHELAHIKYRRMHNDHCYVTDPCLSHLQEFEADWYWARKNTKYALSLENFFRKIANLHWGESADHPSARERYKNLKEIRRLKEAESRWIWGPKGYEKYGDPAYEKAFINWSEKQK